MSKEIREEFEYYEEIESVDSDRKQDHIDLAFESQISHLETDNRFYYEPLLSGHPREETVPIDFLGKQMHAPLWVSSMTGGTEKAGKINTNLARVCAEFGIGMGLGSCRSLLNSDEHLEDFAMRSIIGEKGLLFANLGIAQIEKALDDNTVEDVVNMVERLEADGLIIHVNPLQEWLQPEGDTLRLSPIEILKIFLREVRFKIIVKEVGQGMGPESLKELFQLPIAAVDFAAHGGTNFSKVELLRGDSMSSELYGSLAYVGHDALSMVRMTNQILKDINYRAKCQQVIISGGIRSFLDGYYLMNKLNCKCVYAQGSEFLRRAQHSYEALHAYTRSQIDGLSLARAYLKVKDDESDTH